MEQRIELKRIQTEFLADLKKASKTPKDISQVEYAGILADIFCDYSVKLAEVFEGIQEEPGNRGEVVNMLQKSTGAMNAAWCVSYLVYVINEGLAKPLELPDIVLATASSQNLYKWAKKYEAITKVPYRGAIAVWRNGKTWTGHVGLVKKVIDQNYILTVEGNTGPSKKVNRDGDGVYSKTRSYSKLGEVTNKLWLRGFIDMRKFYIGLILNLQIMLNDS